MDQSGCYLEKEIMKEIGGYIEFEHYHGEMLHDNAIKLNCGRNALAYLLETKSISKLAMPYFMCDSCDRVIQQQGISVRYYRIDLDFKPSAINLEEEEWLYVVNFYGQLSNEYLKQLKDKYKNIIVDNTQAYFQMPVDGIDTIYSCRKYFGVSDGAILYTDKMLEREIPLDESYRRMNFLLGRFERTANEFYREYIDNNHIFIDEPIKRMSKLTENLLHGVDYEGVKNRRNENFNFLHSRLKDINKLSLIVPDGAFMYPLYLENGGILRKKLQEQKIYIPTLWPAVFDRCKSDILEYDLAENILPLPIDQRYGKEEMEILTEELITRLK
jgi:hypothetical protein